MFFLPVAGAAAPATGYTDLERFLDGAQSVTARFSQEIVDSNGRVLDTATGRLQLQRPGRFRWDYRSPYERVVLADGERLWLYEADLEQVTVRRLVDGLGETPAALLTGDRRMLERFEVVSTWAGENARWVRLKPRATDSDFESVAVAFAGDKPVEIEFQDRLGQQTRIRLTEVRLNARIDAAAFRFVAPPGVDVIREDEL